MMNGQQAAKQKNMFEASEGSQCIVVWRLALFVSSRRVWRTDRKTTKKEKTEMENPSFFLHRSTHSGPNLHKFICTYEYTVFIGNAKC